MLLTDLLRFAARSRIVHPLDGGMPEGQSETNSVQELAQRAAEEMENVHRDFWNAFGGDVVIGNDMADSALREKGRKMRRRLLGDAAVERIDKAVYSDPIMAKFAELTQECIFGALWTRPGLDPKIRALICVISDTATGRDPELKLHLRMARNQGWTEDELVESLLHLLCYVGAPLVREALLVAKETFAEMRAET